MAYAMSPGTNIEAAEFAALLLRELSWTDGTVGVSKTVATLYSEHLIGLLGRTLDVVCPKLGEPFEAVRSVVYSLSRQALEDAVCNPYVACALSRLNESDDSYWRNLLLLEFGRQLGESMDRFTPRSIAFDVASDEMSMCLLLNVSISDQLPVPPMDRGGNSVSPFPTEAHDRLVSVLRKALEHLVPNWPALDLFRAGTEMLGLRRELEYLDKFSSGSFRDLPGLTLILNVDAARNFGRDLADALIHEAVHGVIYKYEALGNRLVCGPETVQKRIVSPWTGALLPVDSFVQACFVWYALSRFWLTTDRGAEGRRLHGRAEKGFLSKVYRERCAACSPFLSPGVLQLLAEIPDRL